MLLELHKEDLMYLVQGTSPSYSLFENETVKRCGSYNASYGTWSWNTHELKTLSEIELFSLYKLIKNTK